MTTEVRFLAQHLLHAGLSPLNSRDRRVITRIARRVHVSRDAALAFEESLSLSQRLADRVAAVGGSWAFIVGFCTFLVAWAGLNALVLAERAFDPYPFVFLNLILSMVAALQAPVIMMSQNRQAAKDRLSAALAFEVALKSETAIDDLHGKIDGLQATLDRLLAASEAEPAAPATCLRAA